MTPLDLEPSAATIRLHLLDGLDLTGPDGVPLNSILTQPKRIAILTYLALGAGGTYQRRDTLLPMFWPEFDQERARAALRRALHYLRQSLGEGVLVARGDEEVGLHAERFWCDVAEFRSAVQAGRLEQALDLYKHDLLPGFFVPDSPQFEQWLEDERARLRSLAAHTCTVLSERLEAVHELAEAVKRARDATTYDPTAEPLARRLVALLVRAGDRAGAARAWDAWTRRLEQEYDLAPGPETQRHVALLLAENGPAGRVTTFAAVDFPTPSSPDLPAVTGATRRQAKSVRYAATALVLAAAVILAFRWLSPSTHEIARAVARELETGTASATAPKRPAGCPNNVAAHEFHMKGIENTLFRSASGLREMEKNLRKAIALDPTCAAAHAGLAYFYIARSEIPRTDDTASFSATTTVREWHALARQELKKAFALDDSVARAHLELGHLLTREYDFAGAEAAIKRAAELNPNYNRSPLFPLLIFMRRPEDALAQAESWLQADSTSRDAVAEYAHALLVNDRCAEALVQLDLLAPLDPPKRVAAIVAAQCHAGKKMWREATESLRANQQELGALGQALIAYMEARAGQKARASATLEALTEQWGRRGEGAFHVAIVHAGLGDREQAFLWLDRSIDDLSLDHLIMEPLFAELQADRRFGQLLQRLGLASR